jgi:transposase-like protein
LIRWGYYQRQGLPLVTSINIQRVRCTRCGRTTNVLPSFLLAHRSYAVVAVEQLVARYLHQADVWKKSLNINIELSTAYRWLRRLIEQANTSLPDIRTALLNLKPNFQLTGQLNDKPAPLTSKRDLLKRFITLSEQLFQAVVRLVEPKTPVPSDPFCFLNYFLAIQTEKALLQR